MKRHVRLLALAAAISGFPVSGGDALVLPCAKATGAHVMPRTASSSRRPPTPAVKSKDGHAGQRRRCARASTALLVADQNPGGYQCDAAGPQAGRRRPALTSSSRRLRRNCAGAGTRPPAGTLRRLGHDQGTDTGPRCCSGDRRQGFRPPPAGIAGRTTAARPGARRLDGCGAAARLCAPARAWCCIVISGECWRGWPWKSTPLPAAGQPVSPEAVVADGQTTAAGQALPSPGRERFS